MKAIATNQGQQDTYAHHPVYQQVFHSMGFAVGSPVGTSLEAAHTFRIKRGFSQKQVRY